MASELQKGIDREMARAEKLLPSVVASLSDVIEVKRPPIAEAVFYGKIISKLSPFIGNILESRIVAALNEKVQGGFSWVRQDPDFPDAALFDPNGERTFAGYEVKAWYVLSTEMTGRFKESQNLLAGKNVRLCVVPWMLSNVLYGHPVVLDLVTMDALSVAKTRDSHYHKPPGYLIAEPRDTKKRTRNLQQTNVAGYRLQEDSPNYCVGKLRRFMQSNPTVASNPHSPATQELVQKLMATFDYRLDTNFSKIDRLQHDGIEALKSRILALDYEGVSVRQWAAILTNLESGTEKQQELATEIILRMYNKL